MILTKNKYFQILSRPIIMILTLIFLISYSASAQKKTNNKKSKKSINSFTSNATPGKKALITKKETTLSLTKQAISDTNAVTNGTGPDIETYKEKIRQMISFFEFSLNTIGSDSSSVEEKETIIENSYLKIFRDENVLIEDDLDENRKAVTYKQIQAYLRDVHFFFKKVSFELNIDEINAGTNDENKTFFIASLIRNMKGINIEGDTIYSSKKRYIEINLNEEQRSLQIASIYSSRFNENEELKEWWNTMPMPWRKFFAKDLPVKDSVNLADLKRIVNIENIDISGKKEITDLSPLDKLTKLKSLNISGTDISSLQAIRNITLLEILIADQTKISNLDPLKYCQNLKEISLIECPLNNIEIIKNFRKLEEININKTRINKTDIFSSLLNLKKIECSNTKIEDITPLKNLKQLSFLDISENQIKESEVLSSLENLHILNISNTLISDLKYLSKLKNLKYLNLNGTLTNTLKPILELDIQKIYCENTAVSKEEAAEYVNKHSSSIVICHSQGLMDWWNSLDTNWKNILRKHIKIGEVPDKEQLATIINLTKINLNDNKNISDLSPLSEISNLKEIYLNGTTVEDLEPLMYLDHLQVLEFSGTHVKSLKPLNNMNHLQKINCNDAGINSEELTHFVNDNQQILVIYKTEELMSWWMFLNNEWKSIFSNQIRLDETPTDEQLHKLIKLDSIYFSNTTVSNLEPLLEIKQLEILRFTSTQIEDLCPITELKKIRVLQCSKSPIKSIYAVSQLPELNYLDCDNTGIKDLKPLENAINLRTLKCSGTPIKNINIISNLPFLNTLDISNTRISSIKPLMKMNKLHSLVCFNTSLSEKKINAFRKKQPTSRIIYY